MSDYVMSRDEIFLLLVQLDRINDVQGRKSSPQTIALRQLLQECVTLREERDNLQAEIATIKNALKESGICQVQRKVT